MTYLRFFLDTASALLLAGCLYAVARYAAREARIALAMRRHPAAGELVVPAGMDASEVVDLALWEMELEDHR